MINNLQGGEMVSRVAHNHEVGGSSPSPATKSASDPGSSPALVAGRERATVSPEAVARVLAELENAADFLRSSYLEARIVKGLEEAVIRTQSPWVDRIGAATYCCCSLSEIDRAARAGAFNTYLRGGTPMFLKKDLDEAITLQIWPKRRAA